MNKEEIEEHKKTLDEQGLKDLEYELATRAKWEKERLRKEKIA